MTVLDQQLARMIRQATDDDDDLTVQQPNSNDPAERTRPDQMEEHPRFPEGDPEHVQTNLGSVRGPERATPSTHLKTFDDYEKRK